MSCYGVPSTILNIKEYGGSSQDKTGFKTLKDAKKFRQSVFDKSKKAQKGYLTAVEFAKALEKFKIPGLNLKDFKNTVRLAKSAGVKTIPDTRAFRKGSGGTKFLYEPPNKEMVERIKQNLIKAPATPYGKMMFDKRMDYAKKLLKTGNYSRVEVDKMVKDKFGIGMKSMIEKEARKLGDLVPLGTGEGGTVDKRIKQQLMSLNNSKVKKMLAAGESDIPKLTKEVKKVINVDDSLALRRIGQLIEEYAGRNRYLPESFKNDKIVKATGDLRLGLGKIDSSSRLYGGIGGGLQRKAAEEAFAKMMKMVGSKGKSAVSQIKRKITDLLPRGEGMSKYQTDMVKNIRSGYRFNSLPYSVFAQGLREDINQRKGVLPKGEPGISLDRQTSLYEEKIQKAENQLEKKLKRKPTDTEILKEKKRLGAEYNKIAKDFAKEANKNLKKGQLPVRVLEFSFDPPKETIKNKAAYEKYGDKFEEVYKRHGYSFKVPSDLKTLDQSLEIVKRPVGQAKIATAAEIGSPRIFSELIPGASKAVEGTGKFLKSIPQAQGIKALSTAGRIALPESYFAPASIVLDVYAGRTPKEMALNVATLGFGAPAADAYRKAQVLKDLGFLSDYKKAMAKIDRPQQALAEEVETLGMDTPAEEFAAPEFTKDERLAALIGQVQDLKLNKRLGEKAAEYQELRENQLKKGLLEVTPDEEELPEDLGIKPEIPVGEEEEEENLGFFDRITGNIPRDFMSKGGIMATRLGFASGTGPFPLRMMFMIKDRMQNLKNSTFSNYNDVFRMGEQKGVKNILEPYINIPNKNKLTTALEDIAELKKIMPEEYQSVLDDIANDTKQFNFKTAHDRTEALAETIPSDMDFKKLSEDLFPMPNPENPSFILVGPDSPASAGRYSTTTTIDKFTGKGKRQVYDMFDEETGEFTRPGKLVEEEPLEEEYSEFIRDMDKPDETN